MADASEVTQAQEFFTELDEYSLQQDPIFGLVKRYAESEREGEVSCQAIVK